MNVAAVGNQWNVAMSFTLLYVVIEGAVYGSVSFVHLVKFYIMNNTLSANCSSQHEDRRRDTLRFRRWLLSVYFNVSCEE